MATCHLQVMSLLFHFAFEKAEFVFFPLLIKFIQFQRNALKNHRKKFPMRLLYIVYIYIFKEINKTLRLNETRFQYLAGGIEKNRACN